MTTDQDLDKYTGGWFTELPKAYEKSIVLGGGAVLFPLENTEANAEILREHLMKVAVRAWREGRKAGKAEIRKAIFE